jgi:hypothetical protein
VNAAVELLVQKLTVTHQRGDEFDARCPAHDDRSASLTFGPGRHGGAVLHCHAGCPPEAVLKSVDLNFTDISPEPRLVAVYEYRSETGELLWKTERWEPKTFRQRGLPPPGERVLYHSEWLPNARAEDRTVYVVEGEKDANNLAYAGEVAVCGVNGAGSWLPHYSDQLAGLDVIVIADNDDIGKEHARTVAKSLDGKAERVSLMLPSYGKDISDQLDAGYGLDTLVPLSLEPELGIHRLDTIRERQVSWLWPGYLPAGKLVMIDGDPGDGKSVMTCDLAARFSSGARLPDGQRPSKPTDVVMISAEDDPEDTVKPRLRVAGANDRRVHLITSGTIPDTPFSLTRDLPALERFIAEHHVGLVVIDPLMAFIPSDIDSYRDSDVRRALFPITQMAARTACTILVVRHLVKGRTKAITAGGGSMGFIGAARVGFLVGPHPEDEHKRVLAGVKINVGPMPEPLGYKVTSSIPGDKFAPPMIVWDREPLKLTAQEVLSGGDDEEREARGEARQWLYEYLCINHTGATWVDIIRAGKKEGHSEITLRRVRKSVAHMVANPVGPEGKVRNGIFWVVNKVDGRPDRHLSVVPEPAIETASGPEGVTEKSRQHPGPIVERSSIPVDETDMTVAEFNQAMTEAVPVRIVTAPLFQAPPPGDTCDVCGEKPALWFSTEQARRCVAHHPTLYGGNK